MGPDTAIKLVKSLSGAEKRSFTLQSRRTTGEKDYFTLFGLIDNAPHPDSDTIREAFSRLHPGSSFDNTARYLVKVLTDLLIQTKSDKDPFFQLLQGIMRVKVLRERSLPEEGYRLLKKIGQDAASTQQYLLQYISLREELNYLAENNFPELSDQALIDAQMNAKNILKSLHHIQEHHTLFELLKYRLTHSGKIAAEADKKKLNDLMLSEMILVAGKSKNSFAAQKLHLLFQSFFFTDIGDYQSALKTFHALNRLFEQHLELLDNPPLDYLSALTGILDSLHILGNYEQMAFYLEKLASLDQSAYPEHFRFRIRKSLAVYQLAIHTGAGQAEQALALIRTFSGDWLQAYSMVDEEKQWELYFYCALVFFLQHDRKKAQRYIRDSSIHHRPQAQWLVCKSIRLLDILIHYESGDRSYLEYELRSYKRFFGSRQSLLACEQLLIRYLNRFPDPRRRKIPASEVNRLKKSILAIRENRYERQLLKYFDFLEWMEERMQQLSRK